MGVEVKKALILLITGLFFASIQGQHIVSSVGREALPEVESLHFLNQTPDGKYWATSDKAIIRFDGSRGQLFPIHDYHRKVQLNEYPQSSTMSAPDGRLWITTYEALHVFDPITEVFSSSQLLDHGKLITQDYRLLRIDSLTGEALIRAGQYLWAYNTNTGSYRKVAGPTRGTMFAPLGPDAWAAVRYNDTLEVFRHLPDGVTFEREEYILPDHFISIAPEDDHSLWLGTKRGLAHLEFPTDSSGLRYKIVAQTGVAKSVLRHTDGSIWSTARHTGVIRYDPIQEEITDIFSPEDGLLGQKPQFLSEDHLGRVWVTQYGAGFNVIARRSSNFIRVGPVRDTPVSDLHSPDGREVLVSDGKGKIQRFTGTAMHAPAMASLPSQNDGAHLAAKQRFEASGSQVWAGNQQQLGRYNPDKGDFTWYDRPSDPLSDFYRSGDGLLVVLSTQGIMSVRPAGDSIRLQPLLPFPPSNGTRYTALFGLTDSTFFVCDRGAEIWLCKVRNGAVTINARQPIIGRPFAATQWKNRIFLGTNDGLMEVMEDSIVTILDNKLPEGASRIRSIIADKNSDNLYLGTTTGLLRYNPTTGKQTHFGRAEGLPDEEFLPADPVQLDNGTIWMATKSGIIRFHPDSLVISAQQLTPYVADFWVNDIAQPDDMIGQNLTRVERGYQKNSLSFRLGMIGLLPAGEGMIEYQLKDYNLAPIRVARNEVIHYPRLPAGEYELQLTAIDGRGERSDTATVAIVINPPFWATVWFRLSVLLALALGAMLVYTSLLRRERRKQALIREREAMINAERDRIAGEVHDDLGGQLSSIMFLSEELLLTEAAPTLGYELGRINELSQHSLHNIRDIIFALDNRRATVSDLCEQINTAGQEFFRDHHLAFSFNGDCTCVERPLNSRQKRNLFSVVREAWHNTIKHAQAKGVSMRFEADKDNLIIVISDDGRGLPEGRVEKSTGGYGLGNMKTKAEAIGGSLDVWSKPGQGTKITLRMPLV